MIKYCEDCKHFDDRRWTSEHRCSQTGQGRTGLVTRSEGIYWIIEPRECVQERYYRNDGLSCGPEGKFWEPKEADNGKSQ